jgi:hypothetical protein
VGDGVQAVTAEFVAIRRASWAEDAAVLAALGEDRLLDGWDFPNAFDADLTDEFAWEEYVETEEEQEEWQWPTAL